MTGASPAPHSVDRSGLLPAVGEVELIVARGIEQVQRTVRRAAEEGRTIVPRGAGSGLAGGAVAEPGSIVLDLSRLDRILGIDPVDGVAVVEPGVVLADLDRAAREHGLLYAPDPGSVALATVGGSIATNAGGLRGAKYGVTRDAVLALDVVLADGELVRLGRPTIKGVAGLDLAGLLVGSEGALGIVVGATLRLLPAPVATATAAVHLASLEDAADAVADIARSPARPAVLEIVDGATLSAIDAAEGTGHRALGEALLIVQTDGYGAEAELQAVLEAIGGRAVRTAWTSDPAEAEQLLAARRAALPAIERGGRALIEDIAVPRSRLAEAIRGIRAIAERTGVQIFVFGHAGDGNLHPIIRIGAAAGEPVPPEAEAAADAVFALALELGGTVTAEHGVGLLKRDWAARELGGRVVALQRAAKELFDPRGVLNPGKKL